MSSKHLFWFRATLEQRQWKPRVNIPFRVVLVIWSINIECLMKLVRYALRSKFRFESPGSFGVHDALGRAKPWVQCNPTQLYPGLTKIHGEIRSGCEQGQKESPARGMSGITPPREINVEYLIIVKASRWVSYHRNKKISNIKTHPKARISKTNWEPGSPELARHLHACEKDVWIESPLLYPKIWPPFSSFHSTLNFIIIHITSCFIHTH